MLCASVRNNIWDVELNRPNPFCRGGHWPPAVFVHKRIRAANSRPYNVYYILLIKQNKGERPPVPHINTNIYFVTHSLMERVLTSSISFSSNAARGIAPRSPPLRLRTATTLFSTSLSPIISM